MEYKSVERLQPDLQPWLSANGDKQTPWPENRELVKLGTLTITGVADDQEGLSRSLVFLPSNVPAGIESVDPMIDVRSTAYAISFGERQ
jgi:catalase